MASTNQSTTTADVFSHSSSRDEAGCSRTSTDPSCIDLDIEKALVILLNEANASGFGFQLSHLKDIFGLIYGAENIKSRFKNDRPDKDWCDSFFDRYKDSLKLQKDDQPEDKPETEKAIAHWFDKLQEFLQEHGVFTLLRDPHIWQTYHASAKNSIVMKGNEFVILDTIRLQTPQTNCKRPNVSDVENQQDEGENASHKKKRRLYESSHLHQAIDCVINGGASIQSAAKRFHIPKSTLADKLSGKSELDTKPGPKPYLNPFIEQILIILWRDSQQRGLLFGTHQLQTLCQQIIQEKNLKSQFKNGWPCKTWCASFFKRNPDLAWKLVGSNKGSKTAEVKNKTEKWFEKLQEFLKNHDLQIFLNNLTMWQNYCEESCPMEFSTDPEGPAEQTHDPGASTSQVLQASIQCYKRTSLYRDQEPDVHSIANLEMGLVLLVKDIMRRNLTLTVNQFQELSKLLVKAENLQNFFHGGKPSRSWCRSFLKRHKNLNLENSLHGHSEGAQEEVTNWFNDLTKFLQENNLHCLITEPHIWNQSETNNPDNMDVDIADILDISIHELPDNSEAANLPVSRLKSVRKKGMRKQKLIVNIPPQSPPPTADQQKVPAEGPKKRLQYSSLKLREAMRCVREKGMKPATAAKRFNVPRSTLKDKLNGRFKLDKKPGPEPVMLAEVEKALVIFMNDGLQRGFTLRVFHLQKIFVYISEFRGIPCLFKHGKPGQGWCRNFFKRYPNLTQKPPELQKQDTSAVPSEEDIKRWFQNLKQFLHENELEKFINNPEVWQNYCDTNHPDITSADPVNPERKPRYTAGTKEVRKKYLLSNLQAAVQSVQKGEMNQSTAAKVFNVPRSTLTDKLSGKSKLDSKPGPPPLLDSNVEKALVILLKDGMKKGFTFKLSQVQEMVKHILDTCKIESRFKNNKPGRRWNELFFNRHPELSLDTSEQQGDDTSTAAPTKESMENWMRNFKNYFQKNSLQSLIDNPDSLNAYNSADCVGMESLDNEILQLIEFSNVEVADLDTFSVPPIQTHEEVEVDPNASTDMQNDVENILQEEMEEPINRELEWSQPLSDDVKSDKKPGRVPFFDSRIENALVLFMRDGMTRDLIFKLSNLQDMVKSILESEKILSPFKESKPGRKWCQAFLNRHPDLTVEHVEPQAEGLTTVPRAAISSWFKALTKFLRYNRLQTLTDVPGIWCSFINTHCPEIVSLKETLSKKPVTNVRKKRFQYTSSNIQEAMQKVLSGEMSHSAAAKAFNVPRSTLTDKVHGRSAIDKKPGPNPHLNPDIEKALVILLKDGMRRGCRFQLRHVQDILKQVLDASNIQSPFKNAGMPGKSWYELFFKRHPELKQEKSEHSPRHYTRENIAVNEANVKQWFTNLTMFLQQHGFQAIFSDTEQWA
ncbi:hypothetical protein B566_EDAN019424 [Ephemera danica]|nr:hypothetical protein B566_EDAN019424 [Ephemera danica]